MAEHNFTGFSGLQDTKVEMTSSATDLYGPNPKESTLLDSHIKLIDPASTLTAEGPYTFNFVPPTQWQYLDLASTRLEGIVRVKEKTTASTDWSKATVGKLLLTNLFPQTLWKHVAVFINDANGECQKAKTHFSRTCICLCSFFLFSLQCRIYELRL